MYFVSVTIRVKQDSFRKIFIARTGLNRMRFCERQDYETAITLLCAKTNCKVAVTSIADPDSDLSIQISPTWDWYFKRLFFRRVEPFADHARHFQDIITPSSEGTSLAVADQQPNLAQSASAGNHPALELA